MNVFNGPVDREFANETADSRSIPGRVKPKPTKSCYSQLFCLTFNVIRDSVKPPPCEAVGGPVTAWLEDSKIPTLFPGPGNLVIKNVIAITYNYSTCTKFKENLFYKEEMS